MVTAADTPARKYDPVIKRAQAAILWERLWPKAAAPIGVSGLFLTASWAGLWNALPPTGRVAGVLAFAFTALASPFLVKTGRLRVTRGEAIDRIDRLAGVDLRPLETLRDRATSANPRILGLWNEHLKRIEDKWGSVLRAGYPRSTLPERDPYALRAVLGLMMVVSAAAAGPERIDRIKNAFDWSNPPVPPKELNVQAWVTQPNYLPKRLPDIFLYKAKPKDEQKAAQAMPAPETTQQGPVTVLENSTLTILSLDGKLTIRRDSAEPIAEPKMLGETTARYEITITAADTCFDIVGGPKFCFDVTKDATPTVRLNGAEPTKDARAPNTLTLSVTACDDHGVAGSEVVIEPLDIQEGARPLPMGRSLSVPLPTLKSTCPAQP